jgi:hypothetical protein
MARSTRRTGTSASGAISHAAHRRAGHEHGVDTVVGERGDVAAQPIARHVVDRAVADRPLEEELVGDDGCLDPGEQFTGELGERRRELGDGVDKAEPLH